MGVDLDVPNLVAGALIGFVLSIVANAMTGPALAVVTRFRIVKALAKTRLARDRKFDGSWKVGWRVESPNFPELNEAVVTVHSFFSVMAFEGAYAMGSGRQPYYFVGVMRGGIISGRWYDPRGNEGYYGQFQLRWKGTLDGLDGAWLGWANDGTVKCGPITMRQEGDARGTAMQAAPAPEAATETPAAQPEARQ